MKLEPANIVCPACGSGNYMRHLIGKNVGYLDIKCINCNSYFNFDELYKRRIGEVLKPKPMTNYDRIRAMSVEEMAVEMTAKGGCPHDCDTPDDMDTDCLQCWLDWLREDVRDE